MRFRFCMLLACLVLAGCAEEVPQRKIYVEKQPPRTPTYEHYSPKLTTPDGGGRVALQPPLRTRQPKCSLYESGMASWYGYELYGNNTANGEKFEPEGITAAHKTLPFGTIVKVTMDNGKGNPEGVYVRINDRGPFVHGRIIDLSLGAAKKLGMKDTQPVHIYTCS